MKTWQYQYQLFCLAVSFFSRLPVPKSTPYSDERMNQAGRYFALVGTLLGLLCVLIYAFASLFFPYQVAIVLMMAFSLLLTGAFHEDGLTDMADGIGGGDDARQTPHHHEGQPHRYLWQCHIDHGADW